MNNQWTKVKTSSVVLCVSYVLYVLSYFFITQSYTEKSRSAAERLSFTAS